MLDSILTLPCKGGVGLLELLKGGKAPGPAPGLKVGGV